MTSPLDPELLKIPAFQRKKIIQKRIQAPPQFTVGDAMRSASREEIYEEPMISSSLSRAQENARQSSSLRTPPSKPRSFQKRTFTSISLHQPSLLVDTYPQGSRGALRSYAEIGTVTAVLNKIQVVIIKLSTTLKTGEVLLFETDGQMFEERADSIQIDRKNVKTAKKNAEIGMKISRLPKNGSRVYRVNLK
ncbi:MAG: hypothetical protein WC101_00930 [Candidatus Gracilibacteria bacterium]